MELKSCTIYKGVCVRNVAKKWTSNLPSAIQKKHKLIEKNNCQSESYTWAFSRSHGLLSLSCESVVGHHTQFWVALFRCCNACTLKMYCKNELNNLKIVEMKKQLPKWRMKSQGIMLFRNLTSLSFSSVSGNISALVSAWKMNCTSQTFSPTSTSSAKNVCSQVSALPTIIIFRLKIAQPQKSDPLGRASAGGWCQRSPVDVLNCQRLRSCEIVGEMDFSAKKLRGGRWENPWKMVKICQVARWCFVFFRIGTGSFWNIYSNLCTFRLKVGDDENHRKTPPI